MKLAAFCLVFGMLAGCDLYPVTGDDPVVTGLGRAETSVRPWR